MTITQTRDFLLQIRIIEPRLQHSIQQYDSLKSNLLPSGIRYDLDRVQTTPVDQMSEIFSLLDEMERKILDMQHRREKAAVDITNAIQKLENDYERTVLMMYYVGRKSIDDIADELNYTNRNIYYLRRRGISHLAYILR